MFSHGSSKSIKEIRKRNNNFIIKYIREAGRKDNSFIYVGFLIRNNKLFCRIPIIKRKSKTVKYFWINKKISKRILKSNNLTIDKIKDNILKKNNTEIKIKSSIMDSKLTLSYKNHPLLLENKKWITYVITNSSDFVNLKYCKVNGVCCFSKFGEIVKVNDSVVLLGYIALKNDSRIGIAIISLLKKEELIFELENKIYYLKNGVVIRSRFS